MRVSIAVCLLAFSTASMAQDCTVPRGNTLAIKLPATVEALRDLNRRVGDMAGEGPSRVRIHFDMQIYDRYVRDKNPVEKIWVDYFGDLRAHEVLQQEGLCRDERSEEYHCEEAELLMLHCEPLRDSQGNSLDRDEYAALPRSDCFDTLIIKPLPGQHFLPKEEKPQFKASGVYRLRYVGGNLGNGTYEATPLVECR